MSKENRVLDAIAPEFADLLGQVGINCTGRSTGETTDLPQRNFDAVSRMEPKEFWQRMDRVDERKTRKQMEG